MLSVIKQSRQRGSSESSGSERNTAAKEFRRGWDFSSPVGQLLEFAHRPQLCGAERIHGEQGEQSYFYYRKVELHDLISPLKINVCQEICRKARKNLFSVLADSADKGDWLRRCQSPLSFPSMYFPRRPSNYMAPAPSDPAMGLPYINTIRQYSFS